MTLTLLADVANHLWQSTLVLGVACGLAWLLRRNSAQARFAIWLAASLKFLVPFAPLIAVGRAIGWPSLTTMPQPALSAALNTVNQPFVMPLAMTSGAPATSTAALSTSDWPLALAAIWLTGSIVFFAVWTMRWLSVAALVRRSAPLTDQHVIARLRRAEAVMGVRHPLRAVVSDAAIEPGVFGIVRPVLVWPRDLAEHLTGEQIDGVLIHELAHVRRHDNLTAALHLAVETVFWFFPPVWWLERQLVRERELACDRAAMTAGSDPKEYAEGILQTCRQYAESPLTCVSGVTGSDLKRRVAEIVRGHASEALGFRRRVIVAAAAVAAFAMPLTLGVLQSPLLLAQTQVAGSLPSFEAASVKRSMSEQSGASIRPEGSRITMLNANLLTVIRAAWQIQPSQIVGGPDWVRSEGERFDITAKAADGTPPPQMLLMVQSLLADRFKLKARRETRAIPIYALVLARPDRRLGPQISPASVDCKALTAAANRGERVTWPPANGAKLPCITKTGRGSIVAGGTLMADFATFVLSNFTGGRPVVDRTGLSGDYEFELSWMPEAPAAALLDPNGPSLFTALQEQLGLKLEATTGPVEVLVIDSVDRPTPD
jgi:bla regulator protein blaR1